jgi:signal transduction histidine kinase/CheY-like chemotaxis protein
MMIVRFSAFQKWHLIVALLLNGLAVGLVGYSQVLMIGDDRGSELQSAWAASSKKTDHPTVEPPMRLREIRGLPEFVSNVRILHYCALLVLAVQLAFLAIVGLPLLRKQVASKNAPDTRSGLLPPETDAIRQIQELRRERDEARVATEAKSRFLADMSHEIRTPMNGVIGTTSLLSQTELTASQRKYVDVLHKSGLALVRLTNSILDYSKMQSGSVALEREEYSIRGILDDTLHLFAAEAARKGLELVADIDDELPGILVGDSFRLGEIFSNLVSNAIKFSSTGTIEVTGRVEAEAKTAAGQVELRFEIADPGIGIPEEAQGKLFERFSQVQGTMKNTRHGCGLGLAICRELVLLMGGRIGVRSRPGEGSTFWFTVQLDLPEVTAAPAGQAVQCAPHDQVPVSADLPKFCGRVLAVDDNAVNQLVTKQMLVQLGFEVDLVTDGFAAVDAADRHDYALILMDSQMPQMNGYEAMRLIRAAETGVRHTPIVTLTANASEAARLEAIASGSDAHLTKPITLEKLAGVLSGMRGLESVPGVAESYDQRKSGQQPGTWKTCSDDSPATEAILDETIVEDLLSVRLANGARLLDELAELFHQTVPPLIEEMKTAAARGDRESLRQLAHRLQGSCRQLGANKVTRICAELASLDAKPREREIIQKIAILQHEIAVTHLELEDRVASRRLASTHPR